MLNKILYLTIVLIAVSFVNADLLSIYHFEGSWANGVEGGLAAAARGGATLVTDPQRGGVADLTGDRWLHVGYDPNIDGQITTQMSISIWVRSSATNWFANSRIMGRGFAWLLRVEGSSTALFDAIGIDPIVGTSEINDGQWHHIAVTWDCITGELKLYVDGELDAEATDAVLEAIPNYDRYAIAARATSATEAANIYRGFVDDVRVYNSVLTAQQIANIFDPPDPFQNPPLMDFNNDCVVDLADFVIFAQDWLFCGFWDEDDC